MGSYYCMYDKFLCPYCHKVLGEVIYFDNNDEGFDTGRCEHCKKTYRIDIDFSVDKYDEQEKYDEYNS